VSKPHKTKHKGKHKTPQSKGTTPMAKTITRTSDLSGALDAEPYVLTFGVDGSVVKVDIDLTSEEAQAFADLFKPYIEAGNVRKSRGPKGPNPEIAELRAWAAENGIEVPERGRIPQEIREKYEASKALKAEAEAGDGPKRKK